MSAPRTRKPRPDLVLRPSFVSQENAFAVLGLTPRKFLDEVVPLCHGSVARMGRTALVPIEVAEAVLRSLASASPDAKAGRDCDDGQPTSVDQVLASVGVRRRGSR